MPQLPVHRPACFMELAWKKQDLQVELGDGHVLMQETFLRVKLMRWHQNRELTDIADGYQPTCSPKESWGPTCIIIYQRRALLGLHCLLSHTVLTVLPYIFLWIWVVQAALLDASACCVPLRCTALPSASPLWQGLSFASLVQQKLFLPGGLWLCQDFHRNSPLLLHWDFLLQLVGLALVSIPLGWSPASSQPGSTAHAQPVQDNRGCLCLAACCCGRQPRALLWGQGVFPIMQEFHLSIEGLLQLLAMISSVNDNL